MHTSQTGAHNVIPNAVHLLGTLRSFRSATRDLAERRIREIATGIALAMGGTAEVEITRGYPATVNSERESEFAARVGEHVFGPGNVVRDADPTMGAEDFAYLLQERPGAYVFLGQGGADGGCLLHNPHYDFNDSVIPLGAGFLAALAESAMPLHGSTAVAGAMEVV
jgi:hippurate hydrolase